jgi:hypothetical protein
MPVRVPPELGAIHPAGLWTRVLKEPAEIEALRTDWLRCRRHLQRPEMQLHPDWLLLSSRPAQERRVMPAVAVLYEGSEVRGIAPFRMLSHRWPCRLGYYEPFVFRILLADLCGESLAAPDTESAHELLLTGLIRAQVPLEAMLLESVDTRSFLWRTLTGSAEIRRWYWVYIPQGQTVHHMIQIPESIDEYLAKFGSDGKKKLRRWSRALRDACGGALEIRRVTREEQVPEFLSQVEEISLKSWKASALGRVLRATDESTRQLREYASLGWLRSYVLLCGGAPVAFRTCYQSDGALYLDDTGYDAAWRKHQPGKVLLYLMIEDLFAFERPSWLDFGYGDNEHKRFFANVSYPEANVFLIRKRLRPTMVMVAHSLCARTSRVTRSLLDMASARHKVRQWLRSRGQALKTDGG